ncbi:MAG: Unknown protein [uncultured Sulfurovum sp.]|uniref:Uncharacterized protein n=1 Tax=uncultured Sulfurovum sp. TaxID=269237 RepID=A0A6S6T6A0_9BACT|nr:MAG: Unknown protein [uncultured Sulfurovum sp.]
MTKKVLITLSIIATLAIGITIILSNGQTKDSSMPEEIKNVDAFFAVPTEEENLDKLVDFNENDKQDASMKMVNVEPKKIEVQTVQNIYHEIDKEELLKKIPAKKLVSPILGIEVSQNSIAKLVLGDIIKLPTLGQVEYEAKISKKVTHKNGSTSVTGNLIGDQNTQHAIILTEGKNTSYASISTPEGAFEIETINGIGYVYSVQDIENQYIDRDKEDILHPTEDKH